MTADLFGLTDEEQAALFAGLKKRSTTVGRPADSHVVKTVDAKYTRFAEFPALKQIRVEKAVAEKTGLVNPFFLCHDGIAKATTVIGGVTYLNFSTYDYLDLNGDPRIEKAASEALHRWGTSASASRLVAGERPPHRTLETALAAVYDAEDCVAYVSGHATNVSTIAKLFGPRDLILHDQLSHNSIVVGAQASGAKRLAFPHNDMAALEKLLGQHRSSAERCLIVTEGVFSMDGNVADLPALVRLKKQYGAFLMVDEAHALGVLGATGRGTWEHFGMNPADVDIWMGTLSKTCCGCGGYIAGCRELVELLKYTSPGFVYSVGMSPVLAAASTEALRLMRSEPWRVKKLQDVSHFFVAYAKSLGLNTGKAEGWAVVPVMLGSSLTAGRVATRLFKAHVNVMPIIYPVVEEGAARLRFFLSAAHTEDTVRKALDLTAEAVAAVEAETAADGNQTPTGL